MQWSPRSQDREEPGATLLLFTAPLIWYPACQILSLILFFFLVGEAGGGGGKKLSIFFCYESLILTVRVLKIETISVIYLTNPYSILEATREFHNEQI